MRRAVLVAGLVLGLSAVGLGQRAKAGADWTHVQAIAVGTDVEVRVGKRTMLCALKAVEAESLVCVHGGPDLPKDFTYTRTEIDRVSIARRTRSGVYGGLIGAAGGAGVGGIIQTQSSRLGPFPGAFPLMCGFIGLFTGGPVGYFADFRRDTVYRVR